IRKQIYRFRKFRDANWSISEDYVSKLEQLFYKIQPDTIDQYQYLFTWHPDLLNPVPHSEGDHSDYKREQKMLFEIRANAVKEIVAAYGVDALIDFCSTVEDTQDLGKILTEELFDNLYDFDLLKKVKKSNYSLYATVLWNLVYQHGLEFLVSILKKDDSLSGDEKGDILCHTPLSPEIWAKLELFSQEVADYYWTHVRVMKLDNEFCDSTDYYLEKLLEYNRPFSAIQIIAYTNYNNADIIIRILEKCLQMQGDKEASGISFADVHQHSILSLFDQIYKNQNVDELSVARLEIAYLPLFRYDGNPQCLVRYLQKNPKEYILFISKCYKSDEPSEEELTEERQLQSQTVCEVLDLFRSIPGCNEGEQSADIFNSWISEASEYATLLGYSKVFEVCLGKLLSYSPMGTDGIFPHEIVRDFLEGNNSHSIENELIIWKRNQRGVHVVTGGLAETKIANRYYNNSQVIKITYPKTSSLLARLGDDYKRDSQYEQKQELLDFRE
ncbi:MAG TPA: hypothetical protein VFC70_03735, partial [Oscillospiraceae bacterium]|nr:hypothetical protein [Oscillospiraceae bacterium]